MPSKSEEDVDIGQAYQDLVRAEQTASELESRLDNLDSQLEALIQASNIPPELFSMDDETLKRTLDAASASRQKNSKEEDGERANQSKPVEDQVNGTGGRKDG